MTCERTGVEHTVSVSLPVRIESMEEVPLLLCLDGPWMFGTVQDAVRIMSMSKEAPEAAVIGLSFSDTSMGEYLRQRARWYTPTPWVPPPVTGVRGVTAEECGRAADLQRFVIEQLLPAVESNRLGGVPAGERWLIGHSFSALFGLHILFTAPSTFDKWLLASPSIWWDDRAILRWEADHAAASDDLPTTVFTCHGESEAEPEVGNDSGVAFRMAANLEELVATLTDRAHPSLTLTHQVLPGDGHASSVGAAISKGLRALV